MNGSEQPSLSHAELLRFCCSVLLICPQPPPSLISILFPPWLPLPLGIPASLLSISISRGVASISFLLPSPLSPEWRSLSRRSGQGIPRSGVRLGIPVAALWACVVVGRWLRERDRTHCNNGFWSSQYNTAVSGDTQADIIARPHSIIISISIYQHT